jgi:hypothetical protein
VPLPTIDIQGKVVEKASRLVESFEKTRMGIQEFREKLISILKEERIIS